MAALEGHRQRLEMQQKKLKEAQGERKKNEKIERMKQGPAENMTIAVLKQLLKDKGIAFSSKAKNSELVQIFNTQTGYVTALLGNIGSRATLRPIARERKYLIDYKH